MPFDLRGANSPKVFSMDGPKHVQPKVAVVLQGPMFVHGTFAEHALVLYGVDAVRNVNVLRDVSGKNDKLLGFEQTSTAVNAEVCRTSGTDAHDGPSKLASGAAVSLTTDVAANVGTVGFLAYVTVLSEGRVIDRGVGVDIVVGKPRAGGAKR